MAQAIIAKPRLSVLDEPLSALDRNPRQQMQIELKALQAKLGIAYVFVTHDQEEALTMSDRVVVMRAAAFVALANRSSAPARRQGLGERELTLIRHLRREHRLTGAGILARLGLALYGGSVAFTRRAWAFGAA